MGIEIPTEIECTKSKRNHNVAQQKLNALITQMLSSEIMLLVISILYLYNGICIYIYMRERVSE